jgi:hypothetical protein
MAPRTTELLPIAVAATIAIVMTKHKSVQWMRDVFQLKPYQFEIFFL